MVSGQTVDISFVRANGMVVDQVSIRGGERINTLSTAHSGKLQISNTSSKLLIHGTDFTISISRSNGLITSATYNGRLVLEGGPFLDLGQGQMDGWLLKSFDSSLEGDIATILISGESKQSQGGGWADPVHIDFEIQVDGSGLITTRYRLHEHLESTHLGIAFLLPNTIDRLAWDREALWSIYPEDHIGRSKGIAPRKASHAIQSYRVQPDWPWSQDVGYFLLFGKDGPAPTSTNDFRSLKEHIWYASCILEQGEIRARIEALGNVAVRASSLTDGRVLFSAFNYWKYPDLAWGNYTGPAKPPAESSLEIRLRLTNIREV